MTCLSLCLQNKTHLSHVTHKCEMDCINTSGACAGTQDHEGLCSNPPLCKAPASRPLLCCHETTKHTEKEISSHTEHVPAAPGTFVSLNVPEG